MSFSSELSKHCLHIFRMKVNIVLFILFDFENYFLTLTSQMIYQNSSPPSAAYRRQWIRSALVLIMACRLFGNRTIIWTNAVLLSIGPLGTNFSEILINIQNFHSRKFIWKYRLRKDGHFVQGGDELILNLCPRKYSDDQCRAPYFTGICRVN